MVETDRYLTPINFLPIVGSIQEAGSEMACLFFCQKFKLHEAAEAVEKVRMMNFDNFSIVKNQLLINGLIIE